MNFRCPNCGHEPNLQEDGEVREFSYRDLLYHDWRIMCGCTFTGGPWTLLCCENCYHTAVVRKYLDNIEYLSLGEKYNKGYL